MAQKYFKLSYRFLYINASNSDYLTLRDIFNHAYHTVGRSSNYKI